MSNEQQPGAPAQSSPTVPGKGLAIAAMVLGIVAVVSAPLAPLFTPVSIVTGVVGLVLGLVALRGANKRVATHGGRGQAIAGVVLSAVALLGTVLFLTFLVAARGTMA